MNDDDRKEIEKMINQAVLTKEDIKTDIIKPLLATVNAYHEGDLKLINADLKRILEQTTKHNQRMTKIEDRAVIADEKIIELEKENLQHVEKCPYTDNIRELEDNQLSQKSIKRWITTSVAIGTGCVSVLWIVFQLIGGKI